MREVGRALFVLLAAATALTVSCATGHAGVDDELSVIDGQNRTLTVQQRDTSLTGVAALDRNRLTREWFHSGRADYLVSGPGADGFTGTLELGYQVGFPWTLGIDVKFTYTTPNILLDKARLSAAPSPSRPLGSIITPNLFPGVSIAANLGSGPGMQEIADFSVPVSGPSGDVAVSNAHGTVTGAAGGVLLRPFVRLIGKEGDIVTTYGSPVNLE